MREISIPEKGDGRGLGRVRAFVQTHTRGKTILGHLIVARDGLAWEARFESMGRPIVEFLAGCDAEYLARKLEPAPHDEIGHDWRIDLPERTRRRMLAAREVAEALIQWCVDEAAPREATVGAGKHRACPHCNREVFCPAMQSVYRCAHCGGRFGVTRLGEYA